MIYEVYNKLELTAVYNTIKFLKYVGEKKIHVLFHCKNQILFSIRQGAEHVYSDSVIIGDNMLTYMKHAEI